MPNLSHIGALLNWILLVGRGIAEKFPKTIIIRTFFKFAFSFFKSMHPNKTYFRIYEKISLLYFFSPMFGY